MQTAHPSTRQTNPAHTSLRHTKCTPAHVSALNIHHVSLRCFTPEIAQSRRRHRHRHHCTSQPPYLLLLRCRSLLLPRCCRRLQAGKGVQQPSRGLVHLHLATKTDNRGQHKRLVRVHTATPAAAATGRGVEVGRRVQKRRHLLSCDHTTPGGGVGKSGLRQSLRQPLAATSTFFSTSAIPLTQSSLSNV